MGKKRKLKALFIGLIAFPLSATFTQVSARDFKKHTPPENKYVQTYQISQEAALARRYIQWVDEKGSPTRNAHTLLDYLQDASLHGLNPDVYGANEILVLMRGNRLSPNSKTRLEELLSKGFINYVKDMTGPRVSPSVIDSSPSHWKKRLSTKDVFERYRSEGSLLEMLNNLPPKVPTYMNLQTELQVLLEKEARGFKDKKYLWRNMGRVRQVIANMEKLRWDKERPDRYIELNIADQTLRAVEYGETAFTMKMIVGTIENQTHEFTAKLKGVRFNPPWYIPKSIMLRSQVPKLQEDPYAFEEYIKIYRNGKQIDPATVDWKNIKTKADLKGFMMKQNPGDYNPLGHIRILMPNHHIEYLHATNNPDLFKRWRRAFSAGCMRMEEPEKVVRFIMGYSDEKIASYRSDGRTINRKTSKPVTFFSVYRTVTFDGNGNIKYHGDMYERDEMLYNALKKEGHIPSFKKGKNIRIVSSNLKPPKA